MLPPFATYAMSTTARTTNPNKVNKKPIRLANWRGNALNPVTMFRAWVMSIRMV